MQTTWLNKLNLGLLATNALFLLYVQYLFDKPFWFCVGSPLDIQCKNSICFFTQCNEVMVCADVHFHLSGSQCEVFLVCTGPSRCFWFVYVCVCVSLCYSRHCFTSSVRMAMSAFRAHQSDCWPIRQVQRERTQRREGWKYAKCMAPYKERGSAEQQKREIHLLELMVCLIEWLNFLSTVADLPPVWLTSRGGNADA